MHTLEMRKGFKLKGESDKRVEKIIKNGYQV
jgi:hypothetical protein